MFPPANLPGQMQPPPVTQITAPQGQPPQQQQIAVQPQPPIVPQAAPPGQVHYPGSGEPYVPPPGVGYAQQQQQLQQMNQQISQVPGGQPSQFGHPGPQLQQGFVPQINQPQQQVAPQGLPQQQYVPPQFPQQQVAPQGPPQQQVAPQGPPQQQVAPQGEPSLNVQGWADAQAPQAVLDEAVAMANEMGITDAGGVQQFLDQQLQSGAHLFQDPNSYREYFHKSSQLGEALASQYGAENVQGLLEGARERIMASPGGEALYEKFMTDPKMLDPQQILPWIEGADNQNPYLKHMGVDNQVVGGGTVQAQANNPQQGFAGAHPQQIEARIAQLTNPQTPEEQAYSMSPQGNVERAGLIMQKHQNKVAHQQNLF